MLSAVVKPYLSVESARDALTLIINCGIKVAREQCSPARQRAGREKSQTRPSLKLETDSKYVKCDLSEEKGAEAAALS